MRVLVTGAAGFIGAHLCAALRARGDEVYGVDDYNDYYAPAFKRARVAALNPGFEVATVDVGEAFAMRRLFAELRPQRVVHLAAQAGVRYSLQAPERYLHANLKGFFELLEAARAYPPEHLVYASTSSVYGLAKRLPVIEDDCTDAPISLYAATKKANEVMAASYAHLYGLALTGLRFFTVYGPWGRPDMAPWRFTSAVCAGQPIDVYNHGEMRRDFTYVADIVAGTVAALDRAVGTNRHRIYNLGRGAPVELTRFIAAIERSSGLFAKQRPLPMQPGDVTETHANIDRARAELGYSPQVDIESGVERFVAWYRDCAHCALVG